MASEEQDAFWRRTVQLMYAAGYHPDGREIVGSGLVGPTPVEQQAQAGSSRENVTQEAMDVTMSSSSSAASGATEGMASVSGGSRGAVGGPMTRARILDQEQKAWQRIKSKKKTYSQREAELEELRSRPVVLTDRDDPAAPPVGVLEVQRWQAVASWRWAEDMGACAVCRFGLVEPCIECQSNPGVDECPVAWGECKHTFHKHCIDKWIAARPACPLDNSRWVVTRVDGQKK